MRVFLTGATGVLGRRLVERFTDRDHEVVGLVRDGDGAAHVERRGGIPRRGDVLDPDTLERAMDEETAAVVHAATAIPAVTKPTESDWERNDRVRRTGARNLVAVAGDSVDRFVFPSVVWVARQPNGSRFDESAPRNPDRATRSAAEVERFLQEESTERAFDVTILRCGFLYAPDAAHTRTWGENLLSSDLPIVGGGLFGRRDAELSFLHADDAARAFAAAIDTGTAGLYHVVDDESVTGAEFLRTFATLLDTPEPRRIPGWLARPFVGEEAVRTLTNSMATTAEQFERDVGWKPIYPTYRDGLKQVVETWRNDGTLREDTGGYEWEGD